MKGKAYTRWFFGKLSALGFAFALTLFIGTSCGAGGGDIIVGALLYNQFFKKESNNKIWTGTITDSVGRPLSDYAVTVIGDREAPNQDFLRSGTTDDEGKYRISVPWYADAVFRIEVSRFGTVLLNKFIGKVEEKDQKFDLQLSEEIASVTISGKAVDAQGNELGQVLVTVARPKVIGGEPTELIRDEEDAYKYLITNSSGAFLFDDVYGKPLLIVGFNKDLGFGYLLIEQPSSVNSGGNLVMPSGLDCTLSAKVLNEEGTPIEHRVLSEEDKFNLIVEPAYDLSAQIGALVEEEGLLGGMQSEEVMALHPVERTLEVRSTQAEGISDQRIVLPSGLYKLQLKAPDGSDFDGVILGEPIRMIATPSYVVEVKISA